MRTPRRLAPFAFLFLAAAPAAAQDMIDTFRGDEIDDRSFDFEKQHFLNLLSFDYELSFEREWDLAPSGYRGTAGSLDSESIFLNQEIKIRAQGNDLFATRVHVLQAEDFDSRFVRLTFEPEMKLDERWFLSVPLQLSPEKENLDLGLGLAYRAPGVHYLKLVYLSQDRFFNSETDLDRRYEKNPGTVAFQGSVDLAEGAWTKWTVGQALPLELEVNDEGFDFEFARFFYKQFVQTALGPSSELFLSVAGEQTRKSKDYVPALAASDNVLHRSFVRVRGEYRYRFSGGGELRAGLQYVGLRETDAFPNDPASDEILRRREYTPYLGYGFPVGEKGSLTVTQYFAFLNNKTLDPAKSPAFDSDEHPIAKTSFAFRWDFSPKMHLIVNPSVQYFGTSPYGGTNVQLQVTW